jgi:hypothetical protein
LREFFAALEYDLNEEKTAGEAITHGLYRNTRRSAQFSLSRKNLAHRTGMTSDFWKIISSSPSGSYSFAIEYVVASLDA